MDTARNSTNQPSKISAIKYSPHWIHIYILHDNISWEIQLGSYSLLHCVINLKLIQYSGIGMCRLCDNTMWFYCRTYTSGIFVSFDTEINPFPIEITASHNGILLFFTVSAFVRIPLFWKLSRLHSVIGQVLTYWSGKAVSTILVMNHWPCWYEELWWLSHD